ncbi:MAG: hypothetical protein R3A79_14775 [Nannocystaceae bacterium]
MTIARTLRGAAWIALAAWIVGAPAYRQLGGGRARWMPTWDLYSSVGLDLVRARYFAVRTDAGGATREPIDRYAALGFDDRRKAPRWLRTIRGESGALKVGRALCERLDPGVGLQVEAEIATWDGWAPLFADVDDLCRPLPTRRASRRPRRRG